MNQFPFVVRWGDCDQAGIVFYPRYLEYMNDATHDLMVNCGFVFDAADPSAKGVFPMVALKVEYMASMRLGESGVISSFAESVGRSSIVIEHRVTSGDRVMVLARETRVFAARGADGGLRSQEVPARLKEALFSCK